jgi:hypothetical protein
MHLGFLVSFVAIDVSYPGKMLQFESKLRKFTQKKKLFLSTQERLSSDEEHPHRAPGCASVFCDFQDVRSFEFLLRAEKNNKLSRAREEMSARLGWDFFEFIRRARLQFPETKIQFVFRNWKWNSSLTGGGESDFNGNLYAQQPAAHREVKTWKITEQKFWGFLIVAHLSSARSRVVERKGGWGAANFVADAPWNM